MDTVLTGLIIDRYTTCVIYETCCGSHWLYQVFFSIKPMPRSIPIKCFFPMTIALQKPGYVRHNIHGP